MNEQQKVFTDTVQLTEMHPVSFNGTERNWKKRKTSVIQLVNNITCIYLRNIIQCSQLDS